MTTEFTIKGLKTFDGMEGGGFECSLYMDGKKVGTAFDSGSGGEARLNVTREVESAFEKWAVANSPEEDVIPYWAVQGAICKLVDDFEELKNLKRLCRTKILFQIQGDEDGTWRTVKAKYGTPQGVQAIAWIEGKYAGKVTKIANRDVLAPKG